MSFLSKAKAFIGAAVAAGAYGVAAAQDQNLSFDEISTFLGLAGSAAVAFAAIWWTRNRAT